LFLLIIKKCSLSLAFSHKNSTTPLILKLEGTLKLLGVLGLSELKSCGSEFLFVVEKLTLSFSALKLPPNRYGIKFFLNCNGSTFITISGYGFNFLSILLDQRGRSVLPSLINQ
jgi:hypothetical protein